MEEEDVVKELTDHNLRLTLVETSVKRIDDQVTNHIPTQIAGIHERIDNFFDKLWKLVLTLLIIFGGGGAIYGVVVAVQ